MGLIVCETHRNGFMFACPHIVEAVLAGESCRGIQRLTYSDPDPLLDGMEMSCWFCPQCVENHSLPADGTVISYDDLGSEIHALYRPMCPGCFEDWRAQGLG